MTCLKFRNLNFLAGVALSFSSSLCFASGAFNPSAPGPVNAKFTLGKSIVTGRKGEANCSECHAGKSKFKRNTLQKLGKPISKVVTDCSSHDPCFAEGQAITLSSEELSGLDGYFKRRYRLR